MSKRTFYVLIILVLVLSLGLGFAGGYYGVIVANKTTNKTAVNESAIISENSNNGIINIQTAETVTNAEAIAAKVMPSVVGISTVVTRQVQSFNGFDLFGMGGFGGGFGGYSYDATAVGTGVIVDEAGYILTNSHVVNDGNTKAITVSLFDGSEVTGTVLWNDSTLDLAVVKIEGMNLTAAELGDSDTVNIGSYAAAIGNPLGLQFERSISQGIISGLNRTITVSSDGTSSGATTMEGLMQTDATINSGNSGGPLLNSKGEVIGINSAKASDGEGMGFAIPINVAAPIVKQIKETGKFTRAYLGISGIGLEEQSQYTSAQLEEYFGTSKGIYVNSITTDGGAQKAGIKQGDIIIEVDGISVSTMNKINSILISKKVGDTVKVSYMRDGKIEQCEVVLEGMKLTIQ